MKRIISFITAVCLIFCLSACGETQIGLTHEKLGKTASPAVVKPEPPPPPKHSPFYLDNVSVDDVILYFNEVCLDSEFVYGGDPSFVQKWTSPIYYTLEGPYTEEDLAVLEGFASWLNTVEGFLGIFETDDVFKRNLRICFGSESEMINEMGPDYYGLDGAVTFWYMDNEIYDAIIFYRSDIDQYTRNSVILEELYNGFGPVQDTAFREDSIIYQGFSVPQSLTPTDELILRLLYHPDIKPGMNADECEEIIRALYW